MVRRTQAPDAITQNSTQIVIQTGQAMNSHIANSKSGDIPNTHFIAVGLGLRWHSAFNMDSIISYAKSKQTHKERYAGLHMYNSHRFYISCINTTFYMYWSINDVQQLKITTNTNGNVYILILAQIKFYRVIKKSLCTWWLQYTQVIWRWPSQNTFGMWTVLYWTRSSRTRRVDKCRETGRGHFEHYL